MAQPQGVDVSVPLLPIIALITTIAARVKGRGRGDEKGGGRDGRGGEDGGGGSGGSGGGGK